MNETQTFRDQHGELLKIITEISRRLDPILLAKDASRIRSSLSTLLGKLNVHLAMEDKVLYPMLMSHSDEKVRSMAKSFMDEMGGIADAVAEYKAKWPNVFEIQNDPHGFIEQTKSIFDALTERIEKEDNELYKAAEA